MTDAADLWTAVVASYNADGLLQLTNIRNRAATSIDTAVGQSAAQGVIDVWPVYAQSAYDATNATHVEVAKRGVIAMLWSRGGTASQIAKIEWGEVFGDEGMISKVRRTGARGRRGPSSNSGVRQKTERTESGGLVRGWSDDDALPSNWLPTRRSADDD